MPATAGSVSTIIVSEACILWGFMVRGGFAKKENYSKKYVENIYTLFKKWEKHGKFRTVIALT